MAGCEMIATGNQFFGVDNLYFKTLARLRIKVRPRPLASCSLHPVSLLHQTSSVSGTESRHISPLTLTLFLAPSLHPNRNQYMNYECHFMTIPASLALLLMLADPRDEATAKKVPPSEGSITMGDCKLLVEGGKVKYPQL